MAKTASAPEFDMDIVSAKEASQVLKESRRRGSKTSKYTPVYDAVRDLKKGKFLIMRSVDKSTKLGLYQGIKRNFPDEVKVASARVRDAGGEFYTLVIGRSEDYDEMREMARAG